MRLLALKKVRGPRPIVRSRRTVERRANLYAASFPGYLPSADQPD
jgi:hypothetical protein